MAIYQSIVIGAGWSGAVVAGELAKAGQKVLVLERRPHIGGNCHDTLNELGIRNHSYGPHLFHTDFERVWNYLSQYTDWMPYEHEVLAMIQDREVPIPFNLNSIDLLFDTELAQRLRDKLCSRFGMESKVPILKLREERDPDLEFLAEFVYEQVFKNYTAKQWGMSPESIDPAVTARVPVFVSRDNRYFQDRYQALPKQGYTAVFDKILDHPSIDLQLNTDFKSVLQFKEGKFYFENQVFEGDVIYTGQIDELFDYKFGQLAYRSLHFVYENHDLDFYQSKTTVNYPNHPDFTRITEYKHISPSAVQGQTQIMREYPGAYDPQDPLYQIPYYPIFTPQHQQAYAQYAQAAAQIPQLHLLGRLAEYKYYDQDDAILRALEYCDTLLKSSL